MTGRIKGPSETIQEAHPRRAWLLVIRIIIFFGRTFDLVSERNGFCACAVGLETFDLYSPPWKTTRVFPLRDYS